MTSTASVTSRQPAASETTMRAIEVRSFGGPEELATRSPRAATGCRRGADRDGAAGEFAAVDRADAEARRISVRGIRPVWFPPDTARRLTAAALDAARSGEVRPVVGRTLPLEEAARAHEAIDDRHAFAKTLLTPRPR